MKFLGIILNISFALIISRTVHGQDATRSQSVPLTVEGKNITVRQERNELETDFLLSKLAKNKRGINMQLKRNSESESSQNLQKRAVTKMRRFFFIPKIPIISNAANKLTHAADKMIDPIPVFGGLAKDVEHKFHQSPHSTKDQQVNETHFSSMPNSTKYKINNTSNNKTKLSQSANKSPSTFSSSTSKSNHQTVIKNKDSTTISPPHPFHTSSKQSEIHPIIQKLFHIISGFLSNIFSKKTSTLDVFQKPQARVQTTNITVGSFKCACKTHSCDCTVLGGLHFFFKSDDDTIGTNISCTFLGQTLLNIPIKLMTHPHISMKLFKIFSKQLSIGIQLYNTDTLLVANTVCIQFGLFINNMPAITLSLGCLLFNIDGLPHFHRTSLFRMIGLPILKPSTLLNIIG